MNKKRVLLVNEFSQLATGFSTIGNELLKRLYATDKYILAEQASYCAPGDPRIDMLPWDVFPTIPDKNDTRGVELFNTIRTAQFGAVKFNDHLLEFKPDIILSWRDNWMDQHIAHSPLRPYYKWAYMPTVDGEPQRKDWLWTYKNADILTTYTKWAKNILERDSLKVIDCTMPGSDHNIFKPAEDKKQIKMELGLNPDWIIVQTVMRNQGRKLFPHLLKTFAEFIKICIDNGKTALASKCFLHLHTSLEDVGFDIVDEIQKYNLGHKVLLTYVCAETGKSYISFYKGKRAFSRYGDKLSSITPNTGLGISREALAKIHQIADLYVQYSICVVPETEILTENGWKEIQKISLNDKVLTHKGNYQPVVDIQENELLNRDLLEIKVNNVHKLTCTEEHPIYCLSKSFIETKHEYIREEIGSKIRRNLEIPKPQFICASKLQKGDLVGFYIDNEIKDITKIDLVDYLKDDYHFDDNHIFNLYKDSYPRFIDIDNDFCKFIGLFAADGTYNKNGLSIEISHTKDDKDTMQIFLNFVKKYNLHYSEYTYKDRKATDTILSGKIIANFFEQFSKEQNKQIPNFCLKLPLEKQRNILLGLCLGDGCYKKNSDTTIFCNTSKKLIDQTEIICRRLKLNYNINKTIRGGNRLPIYKIEIAGDLFENKTREGRLNTNNQYYGDYYWLRINSIQKISTNVNKVYNIEVKNDNSYHTRIGCNHNCEGLSCPTIDAKSCGIPTMAMPYSATGELVSDKSGGIPLKIAAFLQESIDQTSQLRSLPDIKYAARAIYEFFEKDESYRKQLGEEARNWVLQNATWDIFAKKWEKIIDSIQCPDQSTTWYSQPNIYQPKVNQIPFDLPNELFILWAYKNIVGRPWILDHQTCVRLQNELAYGFRSINGQNQHYNKQNLVEELINLCQTLNNFDQYRYNIIAKPSSNEIRYAKC